MKTLSLRLRLVALLLTFAMLTAIIPIGSYAIVEAEPTSVTLFGAIKVIGVIATLSLNVAKGYTALRSADEASRNGSGFWDTVNTAIYSFAGKVYDPDNPGGTQTPLYYEDYMRSMGELKTDLMAEFEALNSNIDTVSTKLDDISNDEYINNFLLQYNGGYVFLTNAVMQEYKELSYLLEKGFSTADSVKKVYDELFADAVKLNEHLTYFLTRGVTVDGKSVPIQELLYNSIREASFEYVRSLYETYMLNQYFIQLCSIYQLNYCATRNADTYIVSEGFSFPAEAIAPNACDYYNNFAMATAVLAGFFADGASKVSVNVSGTDFYTVIPSSDSIAVTQKDIIHLPTLRSEAAAILDQSKLYYEISDSNIATVDGCGMVTVKASSGSFSVKMRYDSEIAALTKGNNVCYTLNFTITSSSAFSGGLGTEAHPYLIMNSSDLNALLSSDRYAANHFVLGADIDLDGAVLPTLSSFSGVLNGNGHRIYDFNAVNIIKENNGTIKNLILGHPDYDTIISKSYTETENETTVIFGVLVHTNNGTVDGCMIENIDMTITAQECDNNETFSLMVGGLVGYNSNTLTDCVLKNSAIAASASAPAKSGDDISVHIGGIAMINTNTIMGCVSRYNNLSSSVSVWGGNLNKSVPEAYVSGIVVGNYGIVKYCAAYGGSYTTSAAGTNYKDAVNATALLAALTLSNEFSYCYGAKGAADDLIYGHLGIDTSTLLLFESPGDMSKRLSISDTLYKDPSGLPMPDYVLSTEVAPVHITNAIRGNRGFNTSSLSPVLKMRSGASIVAKHYKTATVLFSDIGEKSITVTAPSISTATYSLNVLCPHRNTEVKVELAPTCNTDGYTDGVYCKDCSTWIYGNDIRPKLNTHSYGEYVSISDTDHKRTCLICKHVEDGEHIWNEGEIVTYPTHIAEGRIKYTCTLCPHTKTEVLPTVGDHSFGAWKNYSDTQHVKECLCGKAEYASHTWNSGEITVQPSHLKEGAKLYTCTGCGATKSEILPKREAHEFSPWNNYTELLHHRVCPCGMNEYDSHEWGDAIPAKPSTHLEEGENIFVCSECNATKTEKLPKLPEHQYAYTIEKQPTATESGIGKYSCLCGEYYTTVLPMRAITLTSEKAFSKNGNTVSLTINVSSNCGFSYLRFSLDYDTSVLTLVKAENGAIISDMDHGLNLLWSASDDSSATGELVTLVFEVSPYAQVGDYTVDIVSRECFNARGEDVGVIFKGSSVTLLDYKNGDANGDGMVNGKDIMILRKYFANYDDTTQSSSVKLYYGADANGDGETDGRDLILLRQYMANYNDETGRSDVQLGAVSEQSA